MIHTIATDLDGTLFYPKRKFKLIKSKNRKFLQHFLEDKNHYVVLVSGRNITLASKIKRKLKNDNIAMIGCNGACVTYKNQIIEEHSFAKDEVKIIYDFLKKRNKAKIFLLFTNKISFIVTVNNLNKAVEIVGKIGLNLQGAYYEKYAFGDEKLEMYLNDDSCKFYKIMPVYGFGKKAILKAKEDLKYLKQELGDKYEILWSNNTIEIMKKQVNKANALKKLLDMLKLDKSGTIVVGDSGNDIPLFENFENSFCMSQAHESVKKKAKHIIKGVYEIEKYL